MSDKWELDHLVMIVEDIDKHFAMYEAQGLEVYVRPVLGAMKDCLVRGKKPRDTLRFKIGYLRKGPFLLKLVQPIEGDSPYMEYLKSHGEGIGHLHFAVSDLEKEKKVMEKNGISIIFEVDHATHKEIHFDTVPLMNMVTELRQQAGDLVTVSAASE